MFSLFGLNMFKRFKHDSSEGSLGLNSWRFNIGAFKQFEHNPLPDPAGNEIHEIIYIFQFLK